MHLSLFKMHSSLMISIFHLFLAQIVIPTYGATSANNLIRTCVNSDNWIEPFWPAKIRQYCRGVISAFEDIEPEVHSILAPAHEFLPVGMAQKPFEGRLLEPVRTPWKISSGALYPHSLACHIYDMGSGFPIFRSNEGQCFRPMHPGCDAC